MSPPPLALQARLLLFVVHALEVQWAAEEHELTRTSALTAADLAWVELVFDRWAREAVG